MKNNKFNFRALVSSTPAALAVILIVFAAGLSSLLPALTAPVPSASSTSATGLTKEQISEAYGKIELNFEQNRGQTDDGAVDFLARGAGYALFLKPHEAVFSLSRQSGEQPASNGERSKNKKDVKREPSATLRMEIVGANPAAEAEAEQKLAGTVNYFTGSDPDKWLTNVPTVGRVRYLEVYPGVDVVYYGNQRQLEYDFVVKPGVSHSQVALKFDGADEVEIEPETGDLLLRVGGETVRQHKPIVYQEAAAGERREIASRYLLREGEQVGFEVGEYDARLPLVIDPVLVYSTYLGGNDNDLGYGIALDASGNVYVTGGTLSTNFPTTTGAFDTSFNASYDLFVTKLNATGSSLVYSTFLGGSETTMGIAVDSAGNAHVVGTTQVTNFPTTSGAFDTTYNGTRDAFVTKLNAAGTNLDYSTFLGAAESDSAGGITLDTTGNAYIVGTTFSTNFPTTTGAFDTTPDTDGEAFVTKLSATGTSLVYSTFLGGNFNDLGRGIAVDSSGNAYVTGETYSTDFPTTTGAFDLTYSGGFTGDAFVTKLNAAGTSLGYSTYLGGSRGDEGRGIAVDSAGNAYVAGYTSSTDFPTTTGAFDTTFGGGVEAFVAKIEDASSPPPAAAADLQVTKTDSPDPVAPGGQITYTVTVSNNGPDAAANVSLTDQIPANTSYVGGRFNGFDACSPNATAAGSTVTCTAASLASGATATLILDVRVNQGTPGGTVITNTANVSSSTADPNGANNSATATTNVASGVDLALSITVSPDPVASGGRLTYQITLANNGSLPAQNVVLTQTDSFRQRGASGLIVESVSAPAGFTCRTGRESGSAPGNVICQGSLDGGGAVQFIVVKGQQTPFPPGTIIDHEALVTTSTAETNTANNRATDSTRVGQR